MVMRKSQSVAGNPFGQKRWYPSIKDFPEPLQFASVRKIMDTVYGIHDRLNEFGARLDKQEALSQKAAEPFPNGPSNTKICGLNVAGTPDATHTTLTYNPTSGQLEWH